MRRPDRFTAAFLISATAPTLAVGHTAATGWAYDRWCCGGQDCQQIHVKDVSVTKDGYLVSIPMGEHMTARRPHTKLFGYDEVQESGDEFYHACIIPDTQEFRCLYVPRVGN